MNKLELEVGTFSLFNMLLAFGIVYKGEWRHQYVAISNHCSLFANFEERMKNGLITVSELKIFREECEVMLGLRSHKNILQVRLPSNVILQLLGVCCSDIEKLCLVTEFCANGSLDKYIHSHPPLKKKIVFNLIKGIAVGMTHLTKEGVVNLYSITISNYNRFIEICQLEMCY